MQRAAPSPVQEPFGVPSGEMSTITSWPFSPAGELFIVEKWDKRGFVG
jgi:hypothetical protein